MNKTVGPLLKVATPLARNFLELLGLTAAASAIDAGILKKIRGSGMITLTILNKEMNNIMKIIKGLEDSGILLKGITKTIEDKTKEQKDWFLEIILVTLGASLLGNMLAGKGIARSGYGNKGKGIVRAGYGFKMDFKRRLILWLILNIKILSE